MTDVLYGGFFDGNRRGPPCPKCRKPTSEVCMVVVYGHHCPECDVMWMEDLDVEGKPLIPTDEWRKKYNKKRKF